MSESDELRAVGAMTTSDLSPNARSSDVVHNRPKRRRWRRKLATVAVVAALMAVVTSMLSDRLPWTHGTRDFILVSPSSDSVIERCYNTFKISGKPPEGTELVLAVQRVDHRQINFKAGFYPDADHHALHDLPMYVGEVGDDDQIFIVTVYLASAGVTASWTPADGYRRLASNEVPGGLTATHTTIRLHRSHGPANCLD